MTRTIAMIVGFLAGTVLGGLGFATVWYSALYSEESLHGPAGMMLCALVAPATGLLGVVAGAILRRTD